jgi:hypothetical protein
MDPGETLTGWYPYRWHGYRTSSLICNAVRTTGSVGQAVFRMAAGRVAAMRQAIVPPNTIQGEPIQSVPS